MDQRIIRLIDDVVVYCNLQFVSRRSLLAEGWDLGNMQRSDNLPNEGSSADYPEPQGAKESLVYLQERIMPVVGVAGTYQKNVETSVSCPKAASRGFAIKQLKNLQAGIVDSSETY